jgi:Domain of Unknown Function (DUF1080)
MNSSLFQIVRAFVCLGFILSQSNLFAETYTSAAKAGLIYKVQGEYLGVVDAWGGTWGAQVVATGEKKVSIHLLKGGLPGQGFSERTPTKELAATLDTTQGQVESTKDSIVVTVKPESLTIADADGKKLGSLTKIVRESSTLGAKPPADAVVLFAVGGANNFKDGKTQEDGLLTVGCTSTEQFGDHRLHIEFRTPFQPDDSGQRRGNSGVYVQGRYEVQVLDSFGLKGEDNECGGIYQIARPKLNMCYPPLTWQTYDIDFKAAKYNDSGVKTSNARITVKHNGVVVHEDLELTAGTPGKDKEANTPGPLFLQNHNNPVVYKNIWILRK